MTAAGAVRDNAGAARYEMAADGALAFAAYRLDGGTIAFTHTEVPASLEGQGIGSRLVAEALDDARRRGLRVVPACSFVAAYVARHSETHDLLADRD